MSSLSIRPALYPAAHARPVEAVAEIIEPDSEQSAERVVKIRVEVAQPAAQTPEKFEAPRTTLRAQSWRDFGFDGPPLTAANADRGRAAAAYAAHASAITAPPPPAGVVIRCRA